MATRTSKSISHARHTRKTDFPSSTEASRITQLLTKCASCELRELCAPCCELTPAEMGMADRLAVSHQRLQPGEPLYRTGDKFTSLYAVRSGFFKITALLEQSTGQITGFSMAGDVLGLDGIAGDIHTVTAVALDDSLVCAIPFANLLKLAHELPSLQRQIARLISRELVREQGVRLLLGNLNAEERVAGFLINLAQRFAANGYSPSEFHLRMSRRDLGSYLCLTVETVSRTFSNLQEKGLIEVQQKLVRIKDHAGLERILRRGLE